MVYSIVLFFLLISIINGQTFQTGIYSTTSESCVNVPVNNCNRICIGGGYNSFVSGSSVTLTPLYSGSDCSCSSITGSISGYSGNGITVTPTYSGATASIVSGSSSCNWVYSFSASSGSSSSKCFPASAKVMTSSGPKPMSHLQIGDKVLVSNNTFSDVYMFSHKYENSINEFIQISAEQHTIKITADHYLYVNGKLATAKTVQIGDKLKDASGEEVTVKHISTQKDYGLYNPHTLHGDIVVDGIITSTYTAAVAPTFAHTMLAPIRMLYNMGIDVMSEKFHEGADALVDVLPKGEEKY